MKTAPLQLGAVLVTILALPVVVVAQIEPQPARDEAERQAAEKPEPVLTRMPEVDVYFDPDYPVDLQREGIEGEVVLLLTISAEGLVTRVEIVESPHTALSEAAVEAARKLEFIPAEVDHVPAPIQIEFGYVFALDITPHRDDKPDSERLRYLEQAAGEAEPPLDPAGDEPADQDEVEEPAEPDHPVTLSGHALVRGLRDPIEGAMVVSREVFTTTDENGYFELRLEPARSHIVEVRAPGFFPFQTTLRIEPGERHEVVYYVQRRGQSPYETVVRAPRPRKEVSRIVLTREEAQRVPGTFGDPLRVVENLPGMARSSFIGGQLLVRGSRPEDSGVYFDGVGIPLLYHFGGLTSVVNAEFIEEMSFLPGGFGAEYGRASAGIIDVTPRRLVGQPARGSAKVDLMDTSIFYRRPLGDSLAVGVAVRRSYVDLFLPFVLGAMTRGDDTVGRVTAAPVYADYQVKVDFSPAPGHNLDLFLFGSRDTLELLTGGSEQTRGFELDMRLSFHRLMLGHEWRIAPKLALRTRPFAGMTLQGGGGRDSDGDLDARFDLDLLEAGLRQDLTWRPREELTVRSGIELYALKGTGVVDAPIPSDLLAFPSPMQPLPDENQAFDASDSASTVAFWTEVIARPRPRFQIVPGLRLEIYNLPDATRPVLEPRLSSRYDLLEGTTLKGAAGLYHKAPTIIEANPVIGNPRLRPERARHMVAGVEQVLTDVLDLDLQVFYNRHTDLVVSSSDTTLEDGQAAGEAFVNRGDGRAYGAEVLLRHKITERAFGWLAYTLMRSERRSSPEREYVVTSHDQTHILTLVGSYRLGRGFEAGARFRLVSGNPYTPVIGSTHDLDTDSWRPIRGPTRSERMPAFHQLDLRLEYTETFDTFTISAFLDLLNAYNRANVESFQYDYRYRNRVGFHGLPIFPVLGARGQW